MRIHFEIREKLPEIIEEILNCERWTTLVKEDISGRKLVVIRDPNYNSEATVEIYAREITIKTAWSNYTYRLFVLGDNVWCEYNGAYRGLLEQNLLPTITPREGLLESEVLDSSLYGSEKRKLREYAEDNLKLKKSRRENFMKIVQVWLILTTPRGYMTNSLKKITWFHLPTNSEVGR